MSTHYTNRSALLAPLLIALSMGVLFMPFEGKAKRAAPPEIKPISDGHDTYFFDHDAIGLAADKRAGYSLYLTKKNDADKSRDWKVKIYQVDYDTNLETDVQDIWLSSLKKNGQTIVATDERDEEYRVDAEKGVLVKPKSFKLYKRGN